MRQVDIAPNVVEDMTWSMVDRIVEEAVDRVERSDNSTLDNVTACAVRQFLLLRHLGVKQCESQIFWD